MNRVFLWIALVLAATFLLGLHLYFQNTRYYIQATAKGVAYKIDRKTGKTWFLRGKEEMLVSEKKIQETGTDALNILRAKNKLQKMQITEAELQALLDLLDQVDGTNKSKKQP